MRETEKARKQVRKNRKRKVRSAYREIKKLAKVKISKAAGNFAHIKVDPEFRLATFIVMKKLERKGFKCELKTGDYVKDIFLNDRLIVDCRS